ncbi:hypothetical protein A2U01_0097319, partial [Trifolium medium]|nr:hypothetical protein [Trifolium medium]
MDSDNPEFGRE